MKAIVIPKYGPPENLRMESVARPDLKEGEVLLRVRAAAINDFDWSLVRGKPWIYRLFLGFFKPKTRIPGIEVSGVVVENRSSRTDLKVGDAVYGDISEFGWGSMAEYLAINPRTLIHMPEGMSFPDAAAISHAANLATQSLLDLGCISRGQKILMNGAGGGMGMYVVQLAKEYDAEVTGVDSADKFEMMRKLGYDHLIDYRKEDFTRAGEKYDLVLDAKTNRPPRAYLRVIKPGGRYVTVGGNLWRILQILIARKIFKRPVFMVGLIQNKDLALINDLYTAGRLRPVLDGPHPLEKVPELILKFGEGKHKGKIVISIGNEE